MMARLLASAVLLIAALCPANAHAEDGQMPPLPAAPDPGGAGYDGRNPWFARVQVENFTGLTSLGGTPNAELRPSAPPALPIDALEGAFAPVTDRFSSSQVLGTEGLLFRPLRLYYNGNLTLRATGDGASSAWPTAWLHGAQRIAYDVRAAYGEIDGGKARGPLSHWFFRAGRQFRYGAGIATFDGLTAGWRHKNVEVAIWGGRRSPQFLDEVDPGFVAGADLTARFASPVGASVDLAANYLFYADRPSLDGTFAAHHLAQLRVRARLGRSGAALRGALSTYDAIGLKAQLAASIPIGRAMQLDASYDLKLGRGLVYDFVAGGGLSPSRFFTLPDEVPRSRLRLRFDHLVGARVEYAVYLNLNLVHPAPFLGGPDEASRSGLTDLSAFDTTWEEIGAILRYASPVFQPELEYRARFVQRAAESGDVRSTAGAGERGFQELRFDLRLRPGAGFSLLSGVVWRIHDFTTRYAPPGAALTVQNDHRVAAVLSASYAFRHRLQLFARYEVGRDSAVFAPELGVVHALWAGASGGF